MPGPMTSPRDDVICFLRYLQIFAPSFRLYLLCSAVPQSSSVVILPRLVSSIFHPDPPLPGQPPVTPSAAPAWVLSLHGVRNRSVGPCGSAAPSAERDLCQGDGLGASVASPGLTGDRRAPTPSRVRALHGAALQNFRATYCC